MRSLRLEAFKQLFNRNGLSIPILENKNGYRSLFIHVFSLPQFAIRDSSF